MLEPAVEEFTQFIAALTGRRGQGNAMPIAQLLIFDTVASRRVEQIDLVHHLDQPIFEDPAKAEIAEHVQNVAVLGFAVRMMAVADMDDDIGLGNLFQSRAESGDEMGRKL